MKINFSKIKNDISGDTFKDFVFGFQDGLITTFVLLCGIAILVIFNPTILVITLLAEIASGAISMCFGAYISTKTENEFIENPNRKYKDNENNEKNNNIDKFKEYFVEEELSDEELESIKDLSNIHPDIWNKLRFNQLITKLKKDPADKAILMGLAFILGGIIPLAPYFIPTPTWSFLIATISSFVGLFIIGIFRNFFTGSKKHWIKPALEMVLFGILAVIIIEVYLYFISFAYGVIILG